jgi:hypothetical protein
MSIALDYEILANIQQCLRVLSNFELLAEKAFDETLYIYSINYCAKFLEEYLILGDAEKVWRDIAPTPRAEGAKT